MKVSNAHTSHALVPYQTHALGEALRASRTTFFAYCSAVMASACSKITRHVKYGTKGTLRHFSPLRQDDGLEGLVARVVRKWV